MDESRFGLLTLAHKALTAKGVKPVCSFQHRFETTYLYGAFSPVNGSHLVLEMPHCNTENFQVFLNEFAKADPGECKVLLLDRVLPFTKQTSYKNQLTFNCCFCPLMHPNSMRQKKSGGALNAN